MSSPANNDRDNFIRALAKQAYRHDLLIKALRAHGYLGAREPESLENAEDFEGFLRVFQLYFKEKRPQGISRIMNVGRCAPALEAPRTAFGTQPSGIEPWYIARAFAVPDPAGPLLNSGISAALIVRYYHGCHLRFGFASVVAGSKRNCVETPVQISSKARSWQPDGETVSPPCIQSQRPARLHLAVFISHGICRSFHSASRFSVPDRSRKGNWQNLSVGRPQRHWSS